MAATQRVIAYVDGFNLYFGLRDSGLRRCYWLDIRRMAEGLLLPHQNLVFTKYFTARIAGGAAWQNRKRKRQSDFLEALATLSDFKLFEGHYLEKTMTCRNCQS